MYNALTSVYHALRAHADNRGRVRARGRHDDGRDRALRQ